MIATPTHTRRSGGAGTCCPPSVRARLHNRLRPGLDEPLDVSVIVASHARRLRLRWLLNALEQQTLEPSRWEVVVVHDYDADTARRMIESHPLSRAGRAQAIAIPAGTGSPAKQRNIGWRAAHGKLVAFVDDDCRPEPPWLAALLTVSADSPRSVIQGATRPDPLESKVMAAPHVRTLSIDPVGIYAQTCNILYPRALLERLGGFDEEAIAGEDVDLSLRARAIGVSFLPAHDAVVNHAVESHTLPGIVRQNFKWRHLAYLVKHHPELRRTFPAGIFWDPQHLQTFAALTGLALARRHPAFLLLAGPYASTAWRRRGRGPRARATALIEVPGQATRQVAELVGLVVGSVRHRTVLL